jgi:hypothetical protein
MLSHANMPLSSKLSLRLMFWERARSGQGFESRQLHHVFHRALSRDFAWTVSGRLLCRVNALVSGHFGVRFP